MNHFTKGSALLITLSVLFLLSCQSKDSSAQSKPTANKDPLVEFAVVQTERLVQKIELTGDVQATQLARLTTPAEGILISLPGREGDRIPKGFVLGQIGRRQGAETLVQSLQKDLEFKELDRKRINDLVQGGSLPGEQLQKAEVAVEIARAQLTKAQESLVDYTIVAPWDGILAEKRVNVGEFVSPRQVLLEMYDPASLRIVAMVSEKEALRVKYGAKADILLDAYPGEKFTGKVQRIYPTLDNRTRSRRIELSLDQKQPILPGMFARIQLQMAQIDSALVIPVKAIQENPKKGASVFVIQNQKAKSVAIKLGLKANGKAQVIEGLQMGDSVVTDGMGKLKDGMKIRLPGAKQ